MTSMRTGPLGALFLILGFVSACGGGSPSAPSPVTSPGLSPVAAQSIIGATLTQASSMVITAAAGGGFSNVLTYNCPGGGTMTMTFTSTTPVSSGPMSTSSRIEFSDCRSQTVTINGDPYLSMAGEYVFSTAGGGGPSSMTATTRMTGGLRFDAGGVQGRAQYNCTQTMSMQIANDGSLPQPSITSTGTISWEQPLGTVTVRPCGP